ncbi:hypothetical protein D3C73_512870 [compost metagenome]
MNLRTLCVAAHTRRSKRLAAGNLLATGDVDRAGMAVNGDLAVVVTYEHGVAELLQTIACVDNDTVFGCLDRRAFRNRDVDTIIAAAIDVGAVAGNDRAIDRPAVLLDPRGLWGDRRNVSFLFDFAERCIFCSGRLGRCCYGRLNLGDSRLLRSCSLRRCLHRLGRFLRNRGSANRVGHAIGNLERLADTNGAIGHAVRSLQRVDRCAGFAGDLGQRVAGLDGVCAAKRLAAGRRDLARLRQRLVTRRQNSELLLGLVFRRRCIVLKIDIASGSLCSIARRTKGRNYDRLAGCERTAICPQDFLFRNAITVCQCLGRLAWPQRDTRRIDR